MVRLTVDLIARSTSGYTKKKRDESIQHYLKRLTHLYLENRGIDDIGDDLSLCRNLNVLYLYDNRLQHVPNLNHNGQLTHLYLQNNHISKLQNLGGLARLAKLYIGSNCITVIEGLEKLTQLQELHLENQKLAPGEKLLFDPRSIAALTHTLQVLNVSGNHLDSIRELQPLYCMSQFMAADNELIDMKDVAHCLSSWKRLWRLELVGNPLCHKSKYRDRLIIMAPALEMLDGKEITETAKQFLRNWQANKDMMKKRRESLMRENSQLDSSMNGGENGDMEHGHGSAMSKHNAQAADAGYIMPALPKKQFQQVLARSGSMPNSANPGGARTVMQRTLSSENAPGHAKYLNTYGTPYHNHQTFPGSSASSRTQQRVATATCVNLGSDYAVGDGMPPVVPHIRS